MENRRSFTNELLRSLPIDKQATVPLDRVMEQWSTFSELFAVALLQPSLDALLNEAARVAAKGSHAPYAKVLEHRSEDGQFLLLAAWNLKPGYLGRLVGGSEADNPAGQCLVERRPVIVPDIRARADYRLPRIFSEHGVVSSVNVPIFGSQRIFGVLEVDAAELQAFDALDLGFLASISGLVGEAVERVRQEAALRTELDARGTLLREQQHRVRNHLQTMHMLLHRHARRAPTEETRRGFEEIERRVFALASLYDHLLGIGLSGRVDLAAYLNDLCDGLCRFYEPEARGIELRCGPHEVVASLDLDACTALGAVVSELVANALEHAFDTNGGTITLRLQQEGGRVLLAISDNGAGFTGDESKSVGLNVARRLLEGFGASLLREPTHSGTRWLIVVPQS